MEKFDNVIYKSNIISEEETKEVIKGTLDLIANSVAKSLGPYGSTTIVEQNTVDQPHFMTKDGYTIIKNMHFYYEIPKTIHKIIEKISYTLVRNVGDGSTSSVVVANALYSTVEEACDKFSIAPQDVINILNELSAIFEELIRNNTIEVTDENFDEIITKIASISTNNDVECGKLICSIFKQISKFGFINIQEGELSVDTFKLENGIEINRGYINVIFANQNDQLSYEYDKALVFMCNDCLSDDEMEKISEWMGTACLRDDIPLIIIAQKYSDSMKAFFHANKVKHKHLPIVAVDMDCSTKKGKEKFDDLALILNCRPFDKFNGIDDINDFTLEDLGVCEKVVGNDLHTKFIGGYGFTHCQDKIQERITELEEELNRLNSADEYNEHRESEIFRIRQRIANLTNSMATLYVGGNSNIERHTRKFLLEDAVYACKSAIENGYIVGGNLILPKLVHKKLDFIINKLMNSEKLLYLTQSLSDTPIINKEQLKELVEDISNCFMKSFIAVLKNSGMNSEDIKKTVQKCVQSEVIYNVKLKRYEKENETSVINSCDTDIEIIKAVFSIIGLIATSNQFMTINPIMAREPK